MNRGRLLAIEGLDGCGKGTQIARLRARLDPAKTLFTREPTDGPHGQQIRAAARKGDAIAPEQELAWFTEDRREHVARVLEPALDAGKLVVTDRYFLSTVAYQGARGLDWQKILRESEAAFPLPDRVVLLCVDAQTAIARVEARGDAREPLFEREDFLAKAAEIFGLIERPYISRIDGSRSEVQVASAVWGAVEAVVGER